MFKPYLFILVLIFFGCVKKDPEPKSEGEITLSSESFGTNVYYRYGYSFEDGNFYQFPVKSPGKIPDIFLLDTPKPPENNLIAFVSTETGNVNGIHKNKSFSDLTTAENFYDNYITGIDGPWEINSDTLENFQVYTLKTKENYFVKMLIIDVREITNISSADFIEVDIRYFIQRDGSSNLFINN